MLWYPLVVFVYPLVPPILLLLLLPLFLLTNSRRNRGIVIECILDHHRPSPSKYGTYLIRDVSYTALSFNTQLPATRPVLTLPNETPEVHNTTHEDFHTPCLPYPECEGFGCRFVCYIREISSSWKTSTIFHLVPVINLGRISSPRV